MAISRFRRPRRPPAPGTGGKVTAQSNPTSETPTLKLHHTAIEVQDLESAIEWYRSMLDFVFERRFELPDARIEIAYMTTDSFRIELLKRADSVREPEGFRPSMHICFEVDDIHAAEVELDGKGVEFAQRPKLIEAARVRNLWIRDHEGHLIEFLEPLD